MADGLLHFAIETWSYGTDSLPILRRSQALRVSLESCKASLYAVGDPNRAVAYSVCAGGGVPLAAFDTDGTFIRIGTQVYAADGDGDYSLFDGTDGEELDYIEEIAGLEDVIAIASRRSPPVATPKASSRTRATDDDDSDSEWAESDDEADISDTSDVSADQGYETSSSCSSADDAEECSEDSDSEYASSCSEQSDVEGEDSEPDDEDEEEVIEANEDDEDDNVYADSDSDDGVDPSTFAFGQVKAYGGEDGRRHRTRGSRNGKHPVSPQVQQAVVQVFGPEGRVFRFRRKTTDALLDSPPVLHPTEPLLAWPLSGREVLFADYEDKTYFIREVGEGSTTGKY